MTNIELAIIAQVLVAWRRHYEGDISIPDLDDEQPITLMVYTTLGDLRKLERTE